MAKQVMPEAQLEPRPTDVKLTEEQFHKISLFAQLKRKPSLDKFPGAIVLRRYQEGDLICRQGEAGWTAFYILTSEDVLEFRRIQLAVATDDDEKRELVKEILTLYQRLKEVKARPEGNEPRRVATVHLTVARPPGSRKSGWFQRLQRRWLGGPAPAPSEPPLYIPFDGPTDINFESRQAAMYEGELFGEMSCLYYTPRSATVVAERECYGLEMLRNILDQLQKDPAFKKRTEETYKQRVLQLHLRNLSIFSHLTEDQFAEIRSEVELVSYEAGQVICDEHERSESMYVIRSGLVKVLKKASALLAAEHIRSWPGLCTALREGAKEAGPRGAIWQRLAEPARTTVLLPDPNRLLEADRAEILCALNDVLKDRQLPEGPEFQAIVRGAEFRERTKDLPEKRKDWSDLEARQFNRLLLEAVFPGLLRGYRRRVGPDCILTYCSRGEFLGEIGLLTRQPRSATCVAYGQRVELIRIPESLFWELIDVSDDIRRNLQADRARREQRTQERLKVRLWEESNNVLVSERAEKLGLVEGQQLMLIDLNRCTRCDECVKACVNTHPDGRSRLFLDGPRFGNYLVPTTCRSCLDPVCLIGCPVGSIHRGDNGQITIEDWCIGCGLCAEQCPYGAIQMHDLGVIPEGVRGWRYLPAPALVGDRWKLAGYRDRRWAAGTTPFHNGREFQARLAHLLKPGDDPAEALEGQAICFRYEFRLSSATLAANGQFRLEMTSADPSATVWVNGQELTTDDKPKHGKRSYWMPQRNAAAPLKAAGRPAPSPLRAGRNVVAVRATPVANPREVLLNVRLNEVRKPDVVSLVAREITEIQVTHRAVVCDLCSTLPGQVPACVNACPHDAALRLDARFELPVR